MTKQAGKITYLVTFIDATMYSLVLKSFSSSGYISIISYVLGKLIGIYLADKIEKKMAIGIIDAKLYVGSKEKMDTIQSLLLDNNFSSTVTVGYLNKDIKRYSLNIELPRKELNKLKTILKDAGLDNPTMVIKDVKAVSGKIKDRIE